MPHPLPLAFEDLLSQFLLLVLFECYDYAIKFRRGESQRSHPCGARFILFSNLNTQS
jgi:hypothetical protein